MERLARIFAGAAGEAHLYVSLFTEFQTYPCADNAWSVDPAATAYYRALKDRYQATMAIFHRRAANARVSLSWGGWQARWDDPTTGAEALAVPAIRRRAGGLRLPELPGHGERRQHRGHPGHGPDRNAYGPVMLAHYKPDNGSGAVFEADLRAILTDRYLAEVTRHGLFAMSFMDDANLAASGELHALARAGVQRYGRP